MFHTKSDSVCIKFFWGLWDPLLQYSGSAYQLFHSALDTFIIKSPLTFENVAEALFFYVRPKLMAAAAAPFYVRVCPMMTAEANR